MVKALDHFDELLKEEEVCRRFRHLVSESELRLARQLGEIAFVIGKKGTILYHPDAVAVFLSKKEIPCLNRDDSGSTATTGSLPRTELRSFTPTGMTSDDERRLADRLAQKFSAKPRTNSSKSPERQKRTEAAPPTG